VSGCGEDWRLPRCILCVFFVFFVANKDKSGKNKITAKITCVKTTPI